MKTPSQRNLKSPAPYTSKKIETEKNIKSIKGGQRKTEREISSTASIKKAEPIIYLEKKSLVKLGKTFAELDILAGHR